MPNRYAVLTRNAMLAALAARVDNDAGPGIVRVYTGTQPATPETAPSGTLLLEFTLADPAFTVPANGAMALDGLPLTATGLAAGDAGWFRMADESGDSAVDGECGAEGSGDALELSTLTISIGLEVNLVAGPVTQPMQ